MSSHTNKPEIPHPLSDYNEMQYRICTKICASSIYNFKKCIQECKKEYNIKDDKN